MEVNKNVFSSHLKEVMQLADRTVSGSEFQADGPTKKSQSGKLSTLLSSAF